jgi:hypothetical protein
MNQEAAIEAVKGAIELPQKIIPKITEKLVKVETA